MSAKKIIGYMLIFLFYAVTFFFVTIYSMVMYTVFLVSWLYGKYTNNWVVYNYIDDYLIPSMFH